MFPPGSPFEQFFKDFLNRNHPGQQGDGDQPAPERRMQSLGSGFIIDPSGLVVTNNHVIDGADEITVTLQDNTTLKADAWSAATRRGDIAAAEGEAGQAAAGGGVRRFRRVARRRLGAGDRQPVRPGRHASPPASSRRAAATSSRGRTTTSSRPTPRSTAATPAARCSTWTAQVIGINTAIYSPSGGSIGIGFSIPSNMAKNVVDAVEATSAIRGAAGWACASSR